MTEKNIFLYPAQLATIQETGLLRTLLGSCVAVFLYDMQLKMGGLNHYLLPNGPEMKQNPLRYGETSIPLLLQKMQEQGSQLQNIQAKIYGGAAVLTHLGSQDTQIGARNIECALALLKGYQIPIIEQKTGGTKGLKISCRIEDFQVIVEEMKHGQESLTETPKIIAKKEIKVLIVDDSITVRQIFTKVLSQEESIRIVGSASDPYEARELLIKEKPDVMLLDIEMPRMNGVQFLEKVMKYQPIPTLMVSSLGAHEEAAERCMELGAYDFIHKPSQFEPRILKELAMQLIHKIQAASSVNISQWMIKKEKIKTNHNNTKIETSSQGKLSYQGKSSLHGQIILIGGNIGSQDALIQILENLAPDSPPVCCCIPPLAAYLHTFIEKNQKKCSCKLVIAQHHTPCMSGHVYLAPPLSHMIIEETSHLHYQIQLKEGGLVYAQKPSTDTLFSSILTFAGKHCIATLLAGFGTDGVEALLRLRNKGVRTIVLDPQEAAFSLTPDQAIQIGAAEKILPSSQIASYFLHLRNEMIL